MRQLPAIPMFLVSACLAMGLSADEEKKAPPVSDKASEAAKAAAQSSSATVDAIMETAVRNIGRRYNLNKPQLEKTHALMKREVYKFLQEHENQVWPLIRDLLKAQLGNRPPENVEDVIRIGKGALPLAKLAQEAIIRANEEWRNYLTAEQRVMHDFDMKEMRKTFESINENFEHWAEGKPPGRSIFPDPQTAGAGPPTPPKPPAGRLPPPIEETIVETMLFFDTYVAEFIAKYDLDAGQTDAARSILKEYKEQAAKFKAANYDELAAITGELLEAQKKRDRKKIAEIETRRRALLKPVYALFGEMDNRLQSLLSSAQRERFAETTGGKTGDHQPIDGVGPVKAPREREGKEGKDPVDPVPDPKSGNGGGVRSAAGESGTDR